MKKKEEEEVNWDGKKFNDLNFIKGIGNGAFSSVQLTKKDGDDSSYYCTKIVNKKKMKKKMAEKYIKSEIKILENIEHPNLVKLVEVQDDDKNYFIVTEFYNGGNLSDLLENKMEKFGGETFTEKEVQHIMRQVVDGLDYLHQKKILHRDLKLDNIMIDYNSEKDKNNINVLNSTLKICDFGFARELKPGELAQSDLGSAPYKDPGLLLKDLMKNKKLRNGVNYAYDEKVDIWSLGILCYEMLMGVWTFDADNMEDLISKVHIGEYYLPTSLHEETVDFIRRMLQKDFDKRASTQELKDHPFLKKDCRNFTAINPRKYNIIDNEIRFKA